MEGKEKKDPGIEYKQTGANPKLGFITKQSRDRVGEHLFKGKQGDNKDKQTMEHDGIGGHSHHKGLKQHGIQNSKGKKQDAARDKIKFHPFFSLKEGIEVVNKQQIIHDRINMMHMGIADIFSPGCDSDKF